MTGATDTRPAPGTRALRLGQTAAILRVEIGRVLLGRRTLALYVLAAMPVLAMLAYALAPDSREIGKISMIYSGVFQAFVVRFVIFFGCVGVFGNLFRGEIVDRSLHYYLLSPVRRDILALGKFLAGLVSTVAVFTATTVASYLLALLAAGPAAAREFLLQGPGAGHLAAYVGVTWLACLGYGAVFLLIGLLVRNPVIPAAAILGWEWINFLLPALLKKISVVHYLQSLMPVPLDQGPFAIIAEPTPAWIAVPGFAAFCGVVLLLSAFVVRRLQIRYESD